jgi:DNA-binding transcriptional ArsR family regulator
LKPITDVDDPRLVRALSHPLRVRVMGVLEQRTATPKELSQALGVGLENIAYHVRALRDFGLIELERSEQVRGAVAHHYRARARPRITARAWEQLPDISKRAMIGAALEQIGDIVSEAAVQGCFARPESHVSRRPLVLDEEGFKEASTIVSEALDELNAVERRAQSRIKKGATEVPTTAVALLFDTPEPSPAPPARSQKGRARSSGQAEPSTRRQ